MDCSRFIHRIYTVDTEYVDIGKVIKPSGLFKEFQEAAHLQMATEHPSYDELLEQGKALLLIRMDMSIPEEICLNDVIDTVGWPCEAKRATFPRGYEMKVDGKTAAYASSQWTLVDIGSRKILKASDVDMSNYTMGEEPEIFPGKFKVDPELEASMETVAQREIMYSSVDYNGHMNNTVYLDMLCDYIPELMTGKRVCGVRIHYANEAPAGEVVTVKRAKKDDGTYVFMTYRSDGLLNTEAEFMLCERR